MRVVLQTSCMWRCLRWLLAFGFHLRTTTPLYGDSCDIPAISPGKISSLGATMIAPLKYYLSILRFLRCLSSVLAHPCKLGHYTADYQAQYPTWVQDWGMGRAISCVMCMASTLYFLELLARVNYLIYTSIIVD